MPPPYASPLVYMARGKDPWLWLMCLCELPLVANTMSRCLLIACFCTQSSLTSAKLDDPQAGRGLKWPSQNDPPHHCTT